MKQNTACSCQCKNKNLQKNPSSSFKTRNYLVFLVIGLIGWFGIYFHLQPLSHFIVHSIFQLDPATHLGSSLEFFFYDTPKVLMLLTLIVYFVGLLRSFISPEKIRHILAGKNEFVGNILASLFGIITPFCSCSAIPLFIGFVTAGVPLGVTFSFLIASPMINEIALILLYGLVGWKIAAIYLLTGLVIAIVSGFIIGKLKMEKYIENWVRELDKTSQDQNKIKMNWSDRFQYATQSVKDIIKRVWIFMAIGIAIGAGIHGYVPQSFMASIMGKNVWWSVPVAVLIGIPLYSNAAGIIPIVEALLGKGAALGTVLAFMMSVTALSFPEMFILRKVLKTRLILVFIIIVALGILLTGYLFNSLI